MSDENHARGAAASETVIGVVLVALAWSTLGCGGGSISAVDPDLLTSMPSYARDVQPLLRSSCESCHASYGPHLGGVELDTYESAFSNRVRAVCTAVTAQQVDEYAEALRPAPRLGAERPPCDGFQVDSMPPGAEPRLTQAERIVLLRWIVSGAGR